MDGANNAGINNPPALDINSPLANDTANLSDASTAISLHNHPSDDVSTIVSENDLQNDIRSRIASGNRLKWIGRALTVLGGISSLTACMAIIGVISISLPVIVPYLAIALSHALLGVGAATSAVGVERTKREEFKHTLRNWRDIQWFEEFVEDKKRNEVIFHLSAFLFFKQYH